MGNKVLIIILLIFSLIIIVLTISMGDSLTGAAVGLGNSKQILTATSGTVSETIGITEAVTCGTVSSNLLFTADVNAVGDCFNITADNLIIDGAGYSLFGNESGIAFDLNGYSNLTITNFTSIFYFTYGILGDNLEDQVDLLFVDEYNVSIGNIVF